MTFEEFSAQTWDRFLSAAEWDGTVSWLEGLSFVNRLGLLDDFMESPWWALLNQRLDAGELGMWVLEG
jgi:hypothetical protein